MGTGDRGQSNEYCWYHEGGPIVFEPFSETTDYFPADGSAMVNLRVRGLREMLDKLRSADIEVTNEQWDTEAGSFARIHDPEGNPLELWEPPAGA